MERFHWKPIPYSENSKSLWERANERAIDTHTNTHAVWHTKFRSTKQTIQIQRIVNCETVDKTKIYDSEFMENNKSPKFNFNDDHWNICESQKRKPKKYKISQEKYKK